MLAYALYLIFIGGFIAIAAIGHALMFSAAYRTYFGAAPVPTRPEYQSWDEPLTLRRHEMREQPRLAA